MSLPTEVAEVLSGTRRWCVVHGDCREVLAALPPRSVDHVLTDPPYSDYVHALQRRMLRGAGRGQTTRTHKGADGRGRGEVGPAELGFGSLSADLRRFCGVHFARVARRWILAYCDQESRHLWQEDLERAGARHVRCGVWRKIAGQPQLSGDRPAVGHEAIEVAHVRGQRMRWNGGGLPAYWVPEFWEHAIATDRHGHGDRVHTTQKPLSLLLEMVEQFTDAGEVVLDPFAGSGTTGVAALRLGRMAILIEQDERYAAVARERLEAEESGLTLKDARDGQMGLFGPAADAEMAKDSEYQAWRDGR